MRFGRLLATGWLGVALGAPAGSATPATFPVKRPAALPPSITLAPVVALRGRPTVITISGAAERPSLEARAATSPTPRRCVEPCRTAGGARPPRHVRHRRTRDRTRAVELPRGDRVAVGRFTSGPGASQSRRSRRRARGPGQRERTP